jgi:hypothetical protein
MGAAAWETTGLSISGKKAPGHLNDPGGQESASLSLEFLPIFRWRLEPFDLIWKHKAVLTNYVHLYSQFLTAV